MGLMDYIGIPEEYQGKVSTALDIIFLLIMIGVFLYTRNVMQHRYQICSNPRKYCPFKYTIYDKKADINWGVFPDVYNSTPNKTKIEKRLYECMQRCDCKCLHGDGPAFMKYEEKSVNILSSNQTQQKDL